MYKITYEQLGNHTLSITSNNLLTITIDNFTVIFADT